MLLLWVTLSSAASCDLDGLHRAMSVLEADLAQRWWAVPEQAKRVEKQLSCTKETVPLVTVLKLHHQLATAAHIGKDFDASAAHLAAAWVASPGTTLPASIPTTSPARGRLAALQETLLAEGTVVRLDDMAWVDGHWAGWTYAELPMIVQEPGKKARLTERETARR